ncbi:MAG TPA: adenosylcobinamide-GDP ribazoletransferase [Candidatus Angelobacter sp.]|nr:adenosylcobinamide-GDP ribazoletransferase [Candidatus Angelobacter sp.]
MRTLREFAAAVQFMTRIPVPAFRYEPGLVLGGAKFYPLVGAVVALGGIATERLLRSHLPPAVTALAVLGYLVAITGGFHEDGLADTTDAFGGGWTRPRMLEIMHDSRIGSFGTLAICLSLLARWVLLTAMPPQRFPMYLLAAHVLCRWSTLPLGTFMDSARGDGLGARFAHKIPFASAAIGSLLAFAIVAWALRMQAFTPVIAVSVITLLCALYYRSQIGGITGDCFGATNQLAEIAVYVCGVWQ